MYFFYHFSRRCLFHRWSWPATILCTEPFPQTVCLCRVCFLWSHTAAVNEQISCCTNWDWLWVCGAVGVQSRGLRLSAIYMTFTCVFCHCGFTRNRLRAQRYLAAVMMLYFTWIKARFCFAEIWLVKTSICSHVISQRTHFLSPRWLRERLRPFEAAANNHLSLETRAHC